MNAKKLIVTGLLSGMLLVPTTALASNGAGSATDPTGEKNSLSKVETRVQTTNTVSGDITPISKPTADYLNSTRKISLANLTNYGSYDSITDGTQTVTFSSSMQRLKVNNGWSSDWGPDVEERSPDVLFSNYANQLTWNLAQPATTFGFELAANLYGSFNYTVDYFSGTALVGSLTQSGRTDFSNGDIKVFGATSKTPFDRVVIRSNSDTQGFAVAQIRYSADNAAPVTNATLTVVKNRLNVKLSASDDLSGVEKTEYRMNGGDWKTYEGSISLNFDQQLQFRSIDGANNTEATHTVGVVEHGYQLENVYINTSDGTVGPFNRTLTTKEQLIKFILKLSH
ncbi:OmpL47-type beta-barrel domain-containing protein [Fictibacillus sp. NRS-1165]|uniref:OmpL47-type beta-barrel domain-containing protein n=1 Tax=Fictibacillus sp. NRS-1165 TaxID=3144463 RepID=UPI003D240C27